MKLLRKYVFTLILIVASFFVMQNDISLAANEVIINNNEHIYDGIQYTSARDINISIDIDETELAKYDDLFDVCEVIPSKDTAGGVRDQENCSYYLKTTKNLVFQLTGRQDGEKTLLVRFYTDYTNKAGKQEFVKKIVLDTIGPVITLTDGEYIYLPEGQSYVEPGATCADDSGIDGATCEVIIEKAEIDMNKSGYQYIRYKAIDFLGNEVNVYRKVLVEIEENESNNNIYWIFAGVGIAILAGFLFIKVWQNKEKQKNQSVL